MLVKTQMYKLFVFSLFIIVFCQSCIHHKEMVTLNGYEEVPKDMRSDQIIQYTNYYNFKPHQIKPYDLLMIKVNAFDGSTEEFLNREFKDDNIYSKQISYDPASLYFNSYGVSAKGYIFLPIIDSIKVEGLTLNQLKLKLDAAYKPYLKFAATNVKLANNRVTVLGEVNKPGLHYLFSEQNTLLDAISAAGDFTDFGNRKKIKLIRQTEEGSKSVYINLFRSDFLSTEYFFVQPNDLIYIEPIKTKSWDVSSKSIGIVISGISLGALLISLFTR